MLLDIEHRFAFDYDAYISESFIELRVHPKTTGDQTVNSFVLSVGPPTRVHRFLDWNDNVTHHFTITRFHNRIEVASRSLVSTHPAAPPIGSITDRVPAGDLPYPLLDFLALGGPVQATPALRAAHKAATPRKGAALGEHVLAVGHHLAKHFEYRKDVTEYDSTTEDFLKIRAGVCQDFAHVTVGALRSLGVPARYISGYLVPVRDTEVGETSKGESHAWVEYWDGGWTPVDPTNGTEVGVDHVVVARGRDYEDVSPFKGIYSGRAKASLDVVVAITRLA